MVEYPLWGSKSHGLWSHLLPDFKQFILSKPQFSPLENRNNNNTYSLGSAGSLSEIMYEFAQWPTPRKLSEITAKTGSAIVAYITHSIGISVKTPFKD